MSEPIAPESTDFMVEKRTLGRLQHRLRIIFGAGFVGALVGIGLTRLAAPMYEARTTLLFPARPSSLLNISAAASALSSLGAATGLAGPSPLKINQSVLESDAALDLVQQSVPGSRRELKRSRRVVPDAPTNTIQILCTADSVAKAQRLARAHVVALRKLNTRLNLESLSSEEGVLSQEYNRRSTQLANAEERLRKFEENSKTFPTVASSGAGDGAIPIGVPGPFAAKLGELDIEIRRLDAQVAEGQRRLKLASTNSANIPTDIPSVRIWRDQLVKLQYELERESITYGPEDARVVRLKQEIAVTERRLTDETKKAIQAIQTGTVDTSYAQALAARTIAGSEREALASLAAAAPGEALTLQRLIREVGALTTVVTRLRGQLGLAQIQDKASGSSFQVLDDARVDEPVNKSMSSGAIRYGFIGLVLGTLLSFIPSRRRLTPKTMEEPNGPTA